MGDPIVQTPELDLLAEGGTVFSHGYSTASVCRPALQTLLTGLHPHQWIQRKEQIEEEIGSIIRPRLEVAYFPDTLPRRLAEVGYRSFQAGKHWEGSFADAGFDAGTAETFSPGATLGNDGNSFGRPEPIDPLWNFVDSASEQPLFLWLAPMLPHVPFDAPTEFRAPYEGQGLVANAILYYANISRLDALIGEILTGFSQREMLQDTLIIYLSDNGWEQEPYIDHWMGSVIGGSRGKMSIYELGFRTPIIFNWPGRVAEGRVLDDLISFEDVHATILDYAGSSVAADHRGFSLRDRIEDPSQPVARDEIIGVMDAQRTRESEFVEGSGLGGLLKEERAAFVRTRDWHYLAYLDRDERELYRIDDDPFEEFDLAVENPDVTTALDARMQDWLETYLAVPEPSSSWLGASALLTIVIFRRTKRRSAPGNRIFC
jgi:uncharacterized sulfatase